VKEKYFTDIRVFRVVPDFVAQFGISGDPKVAAKWADANIPDDPVVQSNIEGTLTFAAAAAPNTRSTQLFINLADNRDQLDHRGFAPIGAIVYGMAVPKSFNAKHGEAPAELQEEIAMKGNGFLDERFPGLDTIKRVVFIEDVQDQNVLIAKRRAEIRQAIANRHAFQAKALRAPDRFKVRIESTRGIILLECHRDWAPNGADRFYTLLKENFYDGAPFFRVVPGFVVQFGLPADPKSHRAWLQVSIPDDPVKEANAKGTIAFAAAGANTRTTQVFFNLDDNAAKLDHQGFAVFGEVTQGMDVVENINPEYGERVDQAKLRQYGDLYVDDYYPRMDRINRAFVEAEHWDNPEAATSLTPAETETAPTTASP
jgi:peptidyl-prolyl cis-trans isomerase A (cyclophilin A)